MDAKTNEKCKLHNNMRTLVKFSCIRRKTSTKTFEKMTSVYSDDCLSWIQEFALHKEFLEGWETDELCNSPCSGQPPTLSTKINVNTVRILTEEDCSLTCREMAAIMDCSNLTIENIMKTWYVACCFGMGPTSFNEAATSRMCWHLHAFEKQISRWPIVYVPCYHMQWNMSLSSWS